jgi:CRISPR-associated protein Cas1
MPIWRVQKGFNMKHLLNTLFVTTQNAYLAREGETVAVCVEHETKLRVPIHTLGGIICFGQVSCSPPLMELCAERNVLISFLSLYGRFLARVQGAVSGNVLLRREQYRRADDETGSAAMAAKMVIGKVANCRRVLLRALNDHPESSGSQELEQAEKRLERQLEILRQPAPLDFVRGLEGEAAKHYFEVFDHLITAQKEDFFFRERSRRPPLDTINALLSFLYTLLAHDVEAALESVGLDPDVGFLHRDRPGRPGLALDMMEELRPVFADRLVLSLVNRQQVKGKGFKRLENGAFQMDDETRKEVLLAWQKRKQEEIVHPFLGEKLVFGLIPFVQAVLLARHLRGDLEGYPPFIWK